ncbi:MAG: SDR family oxidoreductase [Anaerolineales bacterium]|nr:SDR family oxidoreductase [Anaerolineales bacterium]
MTRRFIDQVVIVTGGSRGIGLETCKQFALEGARIIIASVDKSRGLTADLVITNLGGKALFVQTDVTQREQVSRMVETTLSRFGEISVLVNNVGVHDGAPFWEETEDDWARMYQTNVLGVVLPSQMIVKHMIEKGRGSIVHVASKAGVVGEPGHAAYSASKGAVIALTRAMAVELAPYGIRVNAVCPGPVFTDMLFEAVPDESNRQKLAQDTPLGRIGVPEDIAHGILYLASSDADWCTGQAISLDGGLSILK